MFVLNSEGREQRVETRAERPCVSRVSAVTLAMPKVLMQVVQTVLCGLFADVRQEGASPGKHFQACGRP